MRAQRLVRLATLLGLLFGLTASGVTPAPAGIDVCPEPNGDLASACFLGPGGPAPGFIDSPEDVDGYRIELPSDSMIVGTLSGLPGDYSLRLLRADASLLAEASEPGVADKVVRTDGLPSGTYFLAVLSQRGESTADAPYFISVAYPGSLMLNPTAPSAPAGAPQGTYGYIPAPAKSYGLLSSDVGPGFREIVSESTEDGRAFRNRIIGPNSRLVMSNPDLWFTPTDISQIDTLVLVLPYGSNDEISVEFNRVLESLKSSYGANVQPAAGWGSDQVYSFAWRLLSDPEVYVRGILLRNRNAVAEVSIFGLGQHASWDNNSRLMRAVESRIDAAAQ